MKEPSETTYETSSPGNGLRIVVSVTIRLTERQIQQRTRELHLARGGKSHPVSDWLQADRELTAMLNGLQGHKPAVPEEYSCPQTQALSRPSCRRQSQCPWKKPAPCHTT